MKIGQEINGEISGWIEVGFVDFLLDVPICFLVDVNDIFNCLRFNRVYFLRSWLEGVGLKRPPIITIFLKIPNGGQLFVGQNYANGSAYGERFVFDRDALSRPEEIVDLFLTTYYRSLQLWQKERNENEEKKPPGENKQRPNLALIRGGKK